jgi:hypothetical protein
MGKIHKNVHAARDVANCLGNSSWSAKSTPYTLTCNRLEKFIHSLVIIIMILTASVRPLSNS